MPPKNTVNLNSVNDFDVSQSRVIASPISDTPHVTHSGGMAYDNLNVKIGSSNFDKSTGIDDVVDISIGGPKLHAHASGVEILDPVTAFITSGGLLKTPYSFYKTISEEVLHRYLDKTLQVNFLSHPSNGSGPSYGPGYNPTTNVDPLFDEHFEHRQLLEMIKRTGAKFVFDNVIFYSDNHSWNYFDFVLRTLKHDIDFIHKYDPEIICGASLHETVPNYRPSSSPGALERIWHIEIKPPAAVIALFYPHNDRPTTSPYFDVSLMQVNFATADGWNASAHLDLSKAEARMWYYYLATRYIDQGCESIHFGDLFDGSKDDPGNRYLWDLVTKIREYAKTHARRGAVILDTHASNDPTKPNQYGWYYDPAHFPKSECERQLVFDFPTLGVYWEKNHSKWCGDSNTPFGDSELPTLLRYGRGLLNHVKGGLHPQGWTCSHSPVLLRFDHGGKPQVGAGCSYADPSAPSFAPFGYGYDNTSLFVRQKTTIKQDILKYLYYKIKCLDIYCHFAMPARIIYNRSDIDTDLFYTGFSEETTIKQIWSGLIPSPLNWVPHNFTIENLCNSSVQPASSLILVGSDKKFFIGTDGYIHGYVYIGGTYNGGTWQSVSPTYIAKDLHGQYLAPTGISLGSGGQRMAKSDLVASPDGSRLLYIGDDGFIHGFIVHSKFDYEYFSFMKEKMAFQGVRAVSSLIYPGNDRIYYIGTVNPGSNDEKRIHGFQKSSGSWDTVSPTYSASSIHGQLVHKQNQADGALTYVGRVPYDRIYYRDVFGYLSYYEVRNLIDYTWAPCPGNWDLFAQKLKIVGNLAVHRTGSETRFYFVGYYLGNNSRFIHCLIDTGSGWHTVSPSYSADYYGGTPIGSQLQSYKDGNIAVSPDGNTIVYFPATYPPGAPSPSQPVPFLCCYHNVDGVKYTYQCFVTKVSASDDWIHPGNSLQFSNSREFFLNAKFYDVKKVIHFKYEEDFCRNPSISNYE